MAKRWSKQNQSIIIIEYVHYTIEVYLKVLNKKHWSSTFDSVVQVKNIISSQGIDKLHC